MEVDFVKLKKLTPQKHAKCMREGQCFKCRKVGHDAKNYRSSGQPQLNPSTSQTPQQICCTEDIPVNPTPTEKTITSAFATYACTLGKSEDELLQTLRMCYEKSNEEVRVATTFKSDEEGF